MIDYTFLKQLRIVSIVEGISTILLFFVAMPLKYLAGHPEAVRIAGSVHGMLFVALVLMFAIGYLRIPLSWKLTLAGIFGAVIPFGPFVTEIWLRRLAETKADAEHRAE